MLMDLALVLAVVMAALATWLSERAVRGDRRAIANMFEDAAAPASAAANAGRTPSVREATTRVAA
jgi:hypothetical protein